MIKKYAEIMAKQEELNERIRNHPNFYKIYNPFMEHKAKAVHIIGFLRCLRQELCELNTDFAYKHWKNQEPNWEHAKEEWIDCLHFYISIFSTFPELKAHFYDGIIRDSKYKEENPLYKRDDFGIMMVDKLCYYTSKLQETICVIIEQMHEDENVDIINKLVIENDSVINLLFQISMQMSQLSCVVFEKEEDIYTEYLKKNKINHERVDNKY